MNIRDFFNQYSLTARVIPVIFMLLPLLVIVVIKTSLFELDFEGVISGLLLFTILYFLSDLARLAGKKIEKELLEEWGGFPSVAMLRHRDERLSSSEKQHYHHKAEILLQGCSMPTVEEESTDPDKADEVYQVVNNWLLANTRNQDRFHLIFTENINYGFRRNLLGLKFYAIWLILICLLYTLWESWPMITTLMLLPLENIMLISCYMILLLFWIFFVQKQNVYEVAVAYARQLLMALNVL